MHHQAIAMLRSAILSSPLHTPVNQLVTAKRATALEEMFVRVLFPLIDRTLHLHTTLASIQQPESCLTYVYERSSTGRAGHEASHAANEAQFQSLLLASDVLEQVTLARCRACFQCAFGILHMHQSQCFPLLLSCRT